MFSEKQALMKFEVRPIKYIVIIVWTEMSLIALNASKIAQGTENAPFGLAPKTDITALINHTKSGPKLPAISERN